MGSCLTEILSKRIGQVLSQKGIENPEETTLKILRIVFDELFIWLDQEGIGVKGKE